MTEIKYQCNIGPSFSEENQKELLQKTICVFGAGGIGSWVLNYLARIGVKKIICFDNDSFTEEDIGQKCFSNYEVIGQKKVDIILAELKKISPDIIYEFYPFDYEPQYQDKILDADMILNAADMKLETILSLLDTFKNKDYFPYITGFLAEHSIFVINFDLATDKDYFIEFNTKLVKRYENYAIQRKKFGTAVEFHETAYHCGLIGAFFISNMIYTFFPKDNQRPVPLGQYNYMQDCINLFPNYCKEMFDDETL